MARPIEYDKDDVLSNAMEVFWRKGYDSTSLKDLVAATGMTTRSMYNLFESKEGLFKACLNWYYETRVRNRYLKLVKEQGLQAVRNYMLSSSALRSRYGCLFANTSSDRNCMTGESLFIVDDYFRKLEEAFCRQLTYAGEHEGYTADPAIRAKQLVVFLQGLSIHSKSVKSEEEHRKVVLDFMTLAGL